MTPGRLYLSGLWRRRHRLTACVCGALALGALYVLLAEPVYEAQVRVLIQQRGLPFDGQKAKIYDREFLSTQAEVMRSPLTIARAFESLPASVVPESDAEDPVAAAVKALRVSPLANTDIVKVTYQDSDPQRAVELLHAIVESYHSQLRETEQDSAGQSLSLLTQREESLRRELQSLEEEYAALRADSPVVGERGESLSLASAAVRDLAARLAETRSRKWRLETALTSVDTSSPPIQADRILPAITMGDPVAARTLDQLRQSLWQARSQLEEARRIYGPQHSGLQVEEQRVAALQAQLSEQAAGALASLRQQMELIEVEQHGLRTLYEEEHQNLKALDDYLVQEHRLLASIEPTRQLHEATLSLLQNLQLTDQALARGTASIYVRVLDASVAPEKPIWPPAVPLLAVSGLMGLLLGIIGVVLTERLPIPGLMPAPSPARSSQSQGHAEHGPDAEHGDGPDPSLWEQMRQLQHSVANACADPAQTPKSCATKVPTV